MELVEMNAVKLEQALGVQLKSTEEMNAEMDDIEEWDISVMYDVNLDELVKTLNENGLSDIEILNRLKRDEINFMKNKEEQMYYLVIG